MTLQFTFVVRRFVFMDDSFGSQAIQVGFDFAEELLRLGRIFSLAKLLHHRTHLAAMIAVADAPPGILPDAFGG